MFRAAISRSAATLIAALALTSGTGAQERVYTCINNSDGTTTCVSKKDRYTLTCTAAGSGVVSCSDPNGENYNCVLNPDSTVSCRDPQTNETLDCVGLGSGENACKRQRSNVVQPELINDPGLFNKPLIYPDASPIPNLDLPEVIELPSAF